MSAQNDVEDLFLHPAVLGYYGGLRAARTLKRYAFGGRAFAFRASVRLGDGTTGYRVRLPRGDDCWHAAVATTLQVPIEDVPDSRIDERLDEGEPAAQIAATYSREFTRWLAERGLGMAKRIGGLPDEPRWIGVCRWSGVFQDHCLVMAGSEVLFDPVVEFSDREVKEFSASDVREGYVFPPLA